MPGATCHEIRRARTARRGLQAHPAEQRDVLAAATTEPDPGFLTVELAAPDGNCDRGVLQVTGGDYGLRNADEYRAVLTH